MDLLITLLTLSGLYCTTMYVNKLTKKIDEHNDILESED